MVIGSHRLIVLKVLDTAFVPLRLADTFGEDDWEIWDISYAKTALSMLDKDRLS
jgi:hypothetical protein